MLQEGLAQLRIIIAAYLHNALPEDMYIHQPFARGRFEVIHREGPPIDPCTPMQTDEEIFATHHRHSDFDIHTLTRDRDRGLQFFRWKENIEKNVSPVFVTPGAVLHGITNGFFRYNTGITPYHAVEDIPFETADHIRSVQRPCPMGSALSSFLSSKSFTLHLLEDISPKAKGPCRTYKCRITSTDGVMEDASPVLCVKLFDDRFHLMQAPYEGMMHLDVQWWWTEYTTAENLMCSEDSAYKKLEFAQGSLIPRFYGSHLVSSMVLAHIYCVG